MWKLGTEASQFPEKEYINGIFPAVRTEYYMWIRRASVELLVITEPRHESGRGRVPAPPPGGQQVVLSGR
jgi:hypothetical protein